MTEGTRPAVCIVVENLPVLKLSYVAHGLTLANGGNILCRLATDPAHGVFPEGTCLKLTSLR